MMEIHHMSASNICFQTSPVVSYPSFIHVVKDGKVLGEVDARFDFSALASEYRILALQLFGGHRISLPPDRFVETPEPELKPGGSFGESRV